MLAMTRAMDTEKMNSILHKIDIGMFQANARNEAYEEDWSRGGLNRQMKFIHEEWAKVWRGNEMASRIRNHFHSNTNQESVEL